MRNSASTLRPSTLPADSSHFGSLSRSISRATCRLRLWRSSSARSPGGAFELVTRNWRTAPRSLASSAVKLLRMSERKSVIAAATTSASIAQRPSGVDKLKPTARSFRIEWFPRTTTSERTPSAADLAVSRGSIVDAIPNSLVNPSRSENTRSMGPESPRCKTIHTMDLSDNQAALNSSTGDRADPFAKCLADCRIETLRYLATARKLAIQAAQLQHLLLEAVDHRYAGAHLVPEAWD